MKLYDMYGKLVYEGDGYDLSGRNLTFVNFAELKHINDLGLNYCRLTHSRFWNCKYYDFDHANLAYTDFTGADVSCANFNHASFHGTRLKGVKLNWNSKDLLSYLLSIEAGEDVEKLKVAGIVKVKRDWCWANFLAIDDPLKDWALGVFVSYGLEKKNIERYQ